jgi:hypothetical protein
MEERGLWMFRRRFVFCGIAAAFILSGGTHAQEVSSLRASLDAPDQAADARNLGDGSEPVAIAARPTMLEINPLIEPPPAIVTTKHSLRRAAQGDSRIWSSIALT